jgi:hypothetical protein
MINRNDRLSVLQEMAKSARLRPAMFIGSVEEGHLEILRLILNSVCLTDIFYRIRRVRLVVSKNKFWLCLWSVGLKEKYASLIDWAAEPDLLTALDSLCQLTHRSLNTIQTAKLSCGQYLSLRSIIAATSLANYSSIGLQASGHFWWQAFTRGIPDSHVQHTNSFKAGGNEMIGLSIANDLPSDILYNLPYRTEEVSEYVSNIPIKVEVGEMPIIDVRTLITNPPELEISL